MPVDETPVDETPKRFERKLSPLAIAVGVLLLLVIVWLVVTIPV